MTFYPYFVLSWYNYILKLYFSISSLNENAVHCPVHIRVQAYRRFDIINYVLMEQHVVQKK